MNVQDIIGMPIVSKRDGSELGKITNIVMDQNLKYVKKIHLAQNRYIVLDDDVQFTGTSFVVKNSQAVQKLSTDNLDDSENHKNGGIDVNSPESTSQYWWLQINWD